MSQRKRVDLDVFCLGWLTQLTVFGSRDVKMSVYRKELTSSNNVLVVLAEKCLILTETYNKYTHLR